MTFSESQISQVVTETWDKWAALRIWCWYGEMGSGKTTLIKALGTLLGVEDNMSSPTFSIVNEYYSPYHGAIYHFDFFRIEDPAELDNIGIDEYFHSGQPCMIEWPEIVENRLPPDYLEINIKLVGQNQRHLRIIPHGGANEIST